MNNTMTNQTKTSPQPCKCTLYLVRHGEIETKGILAGRTDVALSAVGREQLIKAVSPLQNIRRCISSPLIRCHDVAFEYSQQHNIQLEVTSDLQEMNFGDWDGKTYKALWNINKEPGLPSIGDFWQNPWQNTPPNGEVMSNFVNRVDQWWLQYLSNEVLFNTVVFTHAGVIKHLLARILDLPIPGTEHMTSIDVGYASVIKISLYKDECGKVWSKLML